MGMIWLTQGNFLISYHEIYLHIFPLFNNCSSQRDKYFAKKKSEETVLRNKTDER